MFSHGNAEKNILSSRTKENKYYDDSIKININDKNDSHSIIVNLIPEKTTCLDVGCSAGYIGELLKREKKCKVYGIELDKKAIKKAEEKNVYEAIYNFSITDDKNKEYKLFFDNSIKYDYIIFADVLEHIENPGKVLVEFSKKLKKSGKIIVSIPNIAHIDIAIGLCNRIFNYNEVGILDDTHLRFFTKQSFLEMINNIRTNYDLPLRARVVGKTTYEPAYLGQYSNVYKILNQDKEASVVQYIYEIEFNEKASSQIKNKDYFAKIEQSIVEKNNQNQELESNLNIEIEKNKALTKEIECERKKMNDILESTSWKVTKPLRKIMDFVRKIKNSLNK